MSVIVAFSLHFECNALATHTKWNNSSSVFWSPEGSTLDVFVIPIMQFVCRLSLLLHFAIEIIYFHIFFPHRYLSKLAYCSNPISFQMCRPFLVVNQSVMCKTYFICSITKRTSVAAQQQFCICFSCYCPSANFLSKNRWF